MARAIALHCHLASVQLYELLYERKADTEPAVRMFSVTIDLSEHGKYRL